jgi:hypothetical protein
VLRTTPLVTDHFVEPRLRVPPRSTRRSRHLAAAACALLLASPALAQSTGVDTARVDSLRTVPERDRTGVGLICEFKSGPRVGERQRVPATDGNARVGAPCTDGTGSTGRLVAEDATSMGPTPPDSRRMTTTCQFERGPRAGQRERGIVPTPGRLRPPSR